jgi:DNA invertase Pin-like site-specific DNA recombinase
MKILTNNSQDSGPVRVAIYARYSCDLSKPTSIDDQVRECRAAAEQNGWIVLDEYIRFDAAISGRCLAGRDGLDALIKLAEKEDSRRYRMAHAGNLIP